MMLRKGLEEAIERRVKNAFEMPIDRLGGLCFNQVLDSFVNGELVSVVRCKDCRFCKPLSITPGFYCERMDMDFYAPHYDNAAWYCADGERREAGE